MKGVLIDANLLCLLVVGATGTSQIATHARLRTFEAVDYHNLTAIFERVGDPILCPQVLAETSNLIAYRAGAGVGRFRRSLAHIVRECEEKTNAALDTVNDPGFEWLGFTDIALLLLSANPDHRLLSVDLKLCVEASRRGLHVINYNHIRDGAERIDQIQ